MHNSLTRVKHAPQTRRKTRQTMVGGVPIGGGSPITIQSMTNTDTADTEATVSQILALEQAGCELVRVATYNVKSAENIARIKPRIHIPIIADVHFDHRIALAAIRAGADKIRINPGNIGGDERIREVATAASDAGIPIRVGANTGSIRTDLKEKDRVTALVHSALDNVAALEGVGFDNIVISVKSSSVPECIATARQLSRLTDYPLHLGVTEAGGAYTSAIKSAIGIGALLFDGIGDTVRVSVTGDPVSEIRVAQDILQFMGLRSYRPEIISCPTCARTHGDVEGLACRITEMVSELPLHIKIAIMGCEVNGPGEAKDADIGIALAPKNAVIFEHGEPVAKVALADCEAEFTKRLAAFM